VVRVEARGGFGGRRWLKAAVTKEAARAIKGVGVDSRGDSEVSVTDGDGTARAASGGMGVRMAVENRGANAALRMKPQLKRARRV
jgi:hypothetical protein